MVKKKRRRVFSGVVMYVDKEAGNMSTVTLNRERGRFHILNQKKMNNHHHYGGYSWGLASL